MNAIANNPVTTEDVNIAEKIFGPDISTSMKSRTTRKKPPRVRSDIIEIPKEIMEKHYEVELYMDTMFVNGMPMLTAIDKPINFRSLVPVDSKSAEDYYKALDKIFRAYNRAGFTIKRIHCDGEYKSMTDEVKDKLDIDMNYANPGDHVPQAERNNRVIKERIRVGYH